MIDTTISALLNHLEADNIAVDQITIQKIKEQKDPRALYDVGNIYYRKKGLISDYLKALKYFELAALQNNVKAQNKVGSIYCWGNGVTVDYRKAFEWYYLAANQGYAKAQYHIGWIYQNGKGVLQDNRKAYIWFLKSAVQGNKHAQSSLGFLHHCGLDVPVNYQLSFQWFLKAGNQDHRVAQNWLGYMYYHGEGVSLDKQASLEWYSKAANNGSWEARHECIKLNKEGYYLLSELNKETTDEYIRDGETTTFTTNKDQIIQSLVRSILTANSERKVLQKKNSELVKQVNQQKEVLHIIQYQYKKKKEEKDIIESKIQNWDRVYIKCNKG